MTEPFDPTGYVPLAAAAVGLPIAPAEPADVIGAFSLLMRVAQPLMAFPRPEDLLDAAVFVPGEASE